MIIQVAGMAQLNRILATLPDKCKNAARRELQLALLDLKGKAQEITPVETGDLQGSAFEKINPQGYLLGGVVGFTAPYALKQHEELNYHHDSPGQAKYLERPFTENIGEYIDNIADAIEEALG